MMSDADFMFLGGIFAGVAGGAILGAWVGIKTYKFVQEYKRVMALTNADYAAYKAERRAA